MKKLFHALFILVLVFSFSVSLDFVSRPLSQAKADYNANNLATDEAFINTTTLTNQGIQNFLISKGSFLASFSEGGRSAAQIISDAANTNGINPIAILATIQKEEGIVSGVSAVTYNQTRVEWAMGYGYTDSIIYTQYKGFTNQVDHGTWQLRYNFDVYAANGSEWNVGRNMVIDGQTVTFLTRATSALYRYTPHLGGNENFTNLFWNWGGAGVFGAARGEQGSNNGAGTYGTEIVPGQAFTLWVNYLNNGSNTWYQGGLTPVQLGMYGPRDRGSAFTGGQNVRGALQQASVAPGAVGTFAINFTAPSQYGIYVEKFQPVAEYVGWFGDEISWTLNVSPNAYRAARGEQGPATGAGAYGTELLPGQQFTLLAYYQNTGLATWTKNGNIPVQLGMFAPRDRGSAFTAGQNVRGTLQQASVAPGAIGTFAINFTAPSQYGVYVEHFQPVAEGVSWFGDEISWTLNVSASGCQAQLSAQGPYAGPGTYGVPFSAGQQATLSVAMLNTGTQTWYRDGNLATHLGLNVPRDRGSAFLGGANGRGTLVQAQVAPGETGTFQLVVTAPVAVGLYVEHAQLVMEGVTWFGPDISWPLTVQ